MEKTGDEARNRGKPVIKIIIRKFLVTFLRLCRLKFSLFTNSRTYICILKPKRIILKHVFNKRVKKKTYLTLAGHMDRLWTMSPLYKDWSGRVHT